MRKTSLGVVFVMVGLLAACGGSTPPPEPPPKPAAPAPAPPPPPPPPSAEPAASESAEPEPPPPPPAPEKPKSTATINGTSISDIEGPAVVEAMQKLGWAPQSVEIGGGTVGKYENIRFTLDNNGQGGHLEIVRPAHSPRDGASMMAPKDQVASNEKTGAVFFDKDADVLVVVVIDGKPQVAKQVLGKLVKK